MGSDHFPITIQTNNPSINIKRGTKFKKINQKQIEHKINQIKTKYLYDIEKEIGRVIKENTITYTNNSKHTPKPWWYNKPQKL